MRNLLILLMIILLSCNKTSVSEFKQYNLDAPNVTVNHVPDFKTFCGESTYTSRNNGYFEVLVPYYSLSMKYREVMGIFKYNGKFMYWYQIK